MTKKRKDPRGFINIDTGYFDNPKIDRIRDISPDAVFMHLESMLYSGKHLTDGMVQPRKIMRQVGGDKMDIAHLISAGLWHDQGHECPWCPQPEDGQVYVHDYLMHNRSKADAQKQSSSAKKAALARWERQNEDAPRNAKRIPEGTSQGQDSMRTAYESHTEGHTEPDYDPHEPPF